MEPSASHNEEHRQWLSGKIVEIARNILSGEVGVVASARKVCGLGHEIGGWKDPDFLFFTGVDSEADEFLVVAEVRQHWNAESLKAKDAKLAAYEAKVRERAFEVCRRLISKYQSNTGATPE